MTVYYLTPISAIFQYFNDIGVILAGGKINTYTAGTSTPQATYTDVTGGTTNANPIILGSNGRLNNVQIWQPGGSKLKIVITDANNNQIGPVFDQISGINDPATTLASLANSNTGFGADIVANAVRSYDVFDSMRTANVPSLSGVQTLVVITEGQNTYTDENGGIFYWNATSSATDDDYNVIRPNGAGSIGRYIRLTLPISGHGFFVGTLGGITTVNTQSVFFTVYNRVSTTSARKLVTMYGVGDFQGTSNSDNTFIGGMPAELVPASDRHVACGNIVDNGTVYAGNAVVHGVGGPSAGFVSFGIASVSGSKVIYNLNGFTSSGTKGISDGWTITYNL